MQNRADQMIDKRLESLNALLKRIGEMKRLSAGDKTALQADVQKVIDDLTALKAKIAAETDAAAIKTDTQSIAKAYRVYMLVMPKAQVLAAVDRINTIAANLAGVAQKLQSGLGQVPDGSDTAAAAAALADLNAKVADAQTQAQAASSLVAKLEADNGDKTVAASNFQALKDARAKVLAAQKDLVAAQKDAKTAAQEIKKLTKPVAGPANSANPASKD